MSQAELETNIADAETQSETTGSTSVAAPETKRITVIEPQSGWRAINLSELWQARELFYVLAWRDIKVRYKQTVFGPLWAIAKPIMRIVVFSIIFGRGLKMADEIAPIPYPIFLFVALLPWTFFADSLSTASGSLVRNQNFLTKIYFPRLIIPIASIGPVLVDFIIAFLVLFAMMAYYGINPGAGILMLPVLTLLVMMASLGMGLLASAICVAHRDFRNVIGYCVQIGFYVTPVIYSVSIFPKQYQWLLALNPLAGVIGAFRYYLLGYDKGWSPWWLWVSVIEITVIFIVGVYYFRRVEKTFADVV